MDEPFQAQLLQLRGREQEELHEQAADLTRTQFGQAVFVRGVVEVSNYCRQNCLYCGMRRENRALSRFRAHYEQLADLLVRHRPASMVDLNIQSGEDPAAVREVVLPLVRTLRRETNLGLSVCLGSLSHHLYAELWEAGARVYIMKFETGGSELYARLQAPGQLTERLSHIHALACRGWKVSSGFIVGLPGQTGEELLANLALARRLPLAGCSVSPFIPGETTPLAEASAGDLDLTLNCMALLRLARPEWVIPAVSALNLAGPGTGYRRGLRAGANLVTINLTPTPMRQGYLLYRRDRFIMSEERVLAAIRSEGLEPSTRRLEDFYFTAPALNPAALSASV